MPADGIGLDTLPPRPEALTKDNPP